MTPDSRRHVLVAVLGRTPWILTETPYALCEARQVRIAEAWVISTQEGYEAAV